jgi:hypothetical protein
MTKPEYSKMTGQQLLDAYNAMAGKPRKSKFHTREDGVTACEQLWALQKPVVEIKKDNGGKAVAKDNGVKKKNNGGSAKLALKITLVTKDNPRRDNTDAFRHFEAMRGDITVGDYLAKFKPEDRRKAAQWLSNTVRDKFARVG